MSKNSKHDLGQVLGLILGRQKGLLNCTPGTTPPPELGGAPASRSTLGGEAPPSAPAFPGLMLDTHAIDARR